MDIKEKAHEYALKVLEGEITKLEEAFIEGYNSANSELAKQYFDEDGVEYFDLGLPSGTLWSECLTKKDHPRQLLFLSYVDVEKFSIPTMEQIEELNSNCKLDTHDWNFTSIIGPNGKHFSILKKFWIKNDSSTNNFEYNYSSFRISVSHGFKGDKLGVVLVKNKKDFE